MLFELAARRPITGLLGTFALHALVCVCLLGGYRLAVGKYVVEDRPPKWDEYGWVAASKSTYELMVEDRSSDPGRWRDGLQATTYGAINPNLGKLYMGFALELWGYDLAYPRFFPELGPGHSWFNELTPAQRNEMGGAHVPFINKIRHLMLWTGAASAALVFYIGYATGGPLMAGLAYLAYIATPLVGVTSFLVGTDNPLMLFGLLGVLATLGMARWWSAPSSRNKPWQLSGWVVLLAVLYAAVVATKYNGVIVCISGALALLALWCLGAFRHHPSWQPPIVVASVAVSSFGIFLLLNPQLRNDPVADIRWTLAQWDQLFENFRIMFGGALVGPGEKVAAVVDRALFNAGFVARVSPWTAAGLAGLGFLVACKDGWLGFRSGRIPVAATLLVTWSLGTVVITTLWIPFDWGRFYLPFVPVLCLLQALALTWLWLVVSRRADRVVLR